MNPTYRLTVIGNPIAHSRSPEIHQQFAKQLNIPIIYTKTLCEINDFESCLKRLIQHGFHGANITLPFKEMAFRLSDIQTESARIAKAANTLKFLPEGKILAHNTDGLGFLKDLEDYHHYSITHKRVLILGAGGAVRGLLHPLLTQVPNQVLIANRTLSRAENLAREFNAYGMLTVERYETLHDQFDIIIDGTSFDAWPLPVPEHVIENAEMIYDLKYGNFPTPLMSIAKDKGIKYITDGFGMLLEQAAESFYFWTGVRPSTDYFRA
jgi:shikimate dehydrogenase